MFAVRVHTPKSISIIYSTVQIFYVRNFNDEEDGDDDDDIYVRAETMMIDENKLLFMHAQERVKHSPSSDIDFPFSVSFTFFSFRTAESYCGCFIVYFECSCGGEWAANRPNVVRVMRKVNKSVFY